MDRVFIERLVVRGRHGVYEEERRAEQEFVIDISVRTDLTAAGASDNVADTINYSSLRRIAKETVEQNSFFLIERLAAVIAERILSDVRVASVTVTVRKPSVYPDAAPGITIERSR